MLWAEVSATPQDLWLPYLSAFLILFGIFWLVDPILKETLPSGVSHLLLTAVYLLAAQILVFFSDGVGSPFTLAYLLVIFTGAMAFGLSGAVAATVLSGIAYASFAKTPDDGLVVIRTFLGFLLFAMMIGFLSETKRRVEERVVRQEALLSGLAEAGKIIRAILDRERILEEAPGIARALLSADSARLGKTPSGEGGPRRDRICVEIRTHAGEEPLHLSASRMIDFWGRGRFGRDERNILELLGREIEISLRLERLQEDLRRRETLAALGEMSARVAHEIRNPLGGILGYLSLALRDLPKENPARTSLSQAAAAGENLNRVVTRLLDLTRRGPARREARGPFRIRPISDSIREIFPGIAIEAPEEDLEGEEPTGEERSLLTEILRNLVENAFHAAGRSGGVALRWRTDAAERIQAIEIADDGPGIPPEVAAHLFEPFVTSKERGTGLGLAIARRATRDLGGRIEWARDEERRRTIFRVLLPFAAA